MVISHLSFVRQKPGFCDNLGVLTETQVKKPGFSSQGQMTKDKGQRTKLKIILNYLGNQGYS